MSEYTDQICGIGLPDDEPKPQIPTDKINLSIAVFFDGTLNNKYNIVGANSPTAPSSHKVPKKNNDSYLDTFSNVAELFEAYAENTAKNIGKVYVEGIGTAEPIKDGSGQFVSSGGEDTQDGFAFGKGNQGINAKIERGCKLIVEELGKLKVKANNNKAELVTLTLDVFGFSRGAAAARSFVHRIEKEPEDGITDAEANYMLANCRDPKLAKKIAEERQKMISEGKKVNLRKYLTDRHFKIGEIKVRFLGIFDTVSSFAPGSFIDLDFSNDTRELGLCVPEDVEKTVHLVAADEYRKNFALTTVEPAGSIVELILPGAHSDIGGGYRTIQTEKIVMVPSYYGSKRKELCRGYMTIDELKDGGWLPYGFERWELDKNGKGHLVRTMEERVVYNSYSKIPFELMGEFAKKNNLVFNDKKYNDVKEIQAVHLTFLVAIRALIMGMLSSEKNQFYQFDTESYGLLNKKRTIVKPICSEAEMDIIKGVRARYIHLSAWNEKAAYGLVEPYEPAKYRKRRIYPG